MSDFGLKSDFLAITNFGLVAIPSGSKTDHTSAISASIPQKLAVTCSSNFNNRLTKLTTLNAFGIITLTSGSLNVKDNRLVLRYTDSSSRGIIPATDENGIPITKDLNFTGSEVNDIIVDIPINNNDDSFLVAYRTVEALNKVTSFNAGFKAEIVNDGSSLSSVTASIGNMSIGSGFKIRNSASLGTTSLTDGGEGKFIITSLSSGALALPDFSGTQVQVGGMMVGSSFKVGGSPDTFDFNIITSGSGKMNQAFFPGKLFVASASLIQRMDPDDKKSFEFLVPSQSVGGSDDLIPFYVSSSRKLGFATKDPKTDIDFRADEFQIRRQIEDRGLKVNREGNIESFDNTAESAATGSEVILRYSRGITINQTFINEIFGGGTVSSDEDAQSFFNALSPDQQADSLNKGRDLGLINPAAVGDVIGSVRFIIDSGSSDSFNDRTTGEAAAIQAVVHSVDNTGVRGDLVFKVADQTGTSVQRMVLDAGDDHEITGSFEIGGPSATAGSLRVAGAGGNLLGGIFRFGANVADQKIGRMLVHDDGVIKAQISAKGKSFINGTTGTGTTNTHFGINTSSPTEALHVIGNARIEGNLTAENYIVSSSVVNVTTQQLSGSTAFGDSLDDTHTFIGHITASGNISSSGTITAATLSVATFSPTSLNTGNITASGNISSSGGESTFGQIVNLEGTDPRLRLKAKGANHPGVEWHEDSTRKWVLYNDPDESDSIVFKNDSTELFKITQAGEVQVTDVISHIGDTDTKITFTTDDINITVGNVNMLDFTENAGSQDEITFNEAGADLDIRMEGDADQNLFFLDAGNDKIGIGTGTPGEKLEVIGNISASGAITALSSNIVTINGGSF